LQQQYDGQHPGIVEADRLGAVHPGAADARLALAIRVQRVLGPCSVTSYKFASSAAAARPSLICAMESSTVLSPKDAPERVTIASPAAASAVTIPARSRAG